MLKDQVIDVFNTVISIVHNLQLHVHLSHKHKVFLTLKKGRPLLIKHSLIYETGSNRIIAGTNLSYRDLQ